MAKKIYSEKYKGFEIIGEYDENICRLNPDSRVVEKVGGIRFDIFDAEANPGSPKLFTDRFALGYEIYETSDEVFEKAIVKYINHQTPYLMEQKEQEISKRRLRQLSKAIEYIAKEKSGEELYNVLSKDFGMTDHDIVVTGHAELVSYFDLESYAEVVAGHLVREGTWETSNGSYNVSFAEIKENFGLDLKSDKNLAYKIEDAIFDIYGDLVAELDVYDDTFDFMFFLAYCPNADEDEG